jgi:hypothetical protein
VAVRLPFSRLVHADWSISPRKRWAAVADRLDDGWRVAAPFPVGNTNAFLAVLIAGTRPTLVGFDFPIGLPQFYGEATGLSGFLSALAAFGTTPWSRFYEVAETPDDISIHRPFCPRQATKGVKRSNLLGALGSNSIEQLLRRCDQQTAIRRAACSLFWTLGPNQVGKAAIAGWREILGPARQLGARIWPFEGSLAALVNSPVVIAETYPAEAYAHIGVRFCRGRSKARQQDRIEAANRLEARSASNKITIDEELSRQIKNGFGSNREGEDAFDAAIGLFGMIEVADQRRLEGSTEGVWEGWILGQATS